MTAIWLAILKVAVLARSGHGLSSPSQRGLARINSARARVSSNGDTALDVDALSEGGRRTACKDDSTRRRSGTSCETFSKKRRCHFGEAFSHCKGTCNVPPPCAAQKTDIEFGGNTHATSTDGETQRPEQVKALACDASACTECVDRDGCWHGTGGSADNGHLEVQLAAGGLHNRHRAELWVRCGSGGGSWSVWAVRLKNGHLKVYTNDTLVQTITESTMSLKPSQHITVDLALNEHSSHLHVDFVRTIINQPAYAEIYVLAMGVDPYVEKCMNMKNCLKEMGRGSTSEFCLRNSNLLQLLCLNAPTKKARWAISPDCVPWERCLSRGGHKENVRAILSAAIPNAATAALPSCSGGHPEVLADPGCFILQPSGCPRHKSFNARVWTQDTYGEKNYGAGESKNRCMARRSAYNGWCGVSDTQAHFTPSETACAVHPGCAHLGAGDCCPASDGKSLACCWQEASTANSSEEATAGGFSETAVGESSSTAISPQVPADPGCYILQPSGCPNAAWFKAPVWTRDTHGESHGTRDNKNACLARKSALDGWCGISDTQMHFTPDAGSEPATAGDASETAAGESSSTAITPEIPSTEKGAAHNSGDEATAGDASETAESSSTAITPEVPTDPGCYILQPSGCPNAAWFKAPVWTRDTHGESHGARDNKNACLARKSALDGWCGISDTQMHFTPDAGSKPATAGDTSETAAGESSSTAITHEIPSTEEGAAHNSGDEATAGDTSETAAGESSSTAITPEVPTDPGCYILQSSGCPNAAWFKAPEWTRDTFGEEKLGAGDDKNACLERKISLDTWCGISDTQMHFTPNAAPACAAHPKCSHFGGDCCPATDGTMLACCSQEASTGSQEASTGNSGDEATAGGASEKAAGDSSSTATTPEVQLDSDNCIDPSVDDPESWECACFSNMKRECGGIDDNCFRCIMCKSPHICDSWTSKWCTDPTWKQMHCPDAFISKADSLFEVTSDARIAMNIGSRHMAVKGGADTGLDGALRDKCTG